MTFELRIEPTGQCISVEPDQNVLDACLRAGIWLPHACCHGLCATCKVRVLEGEVEHGEASPFALMEFEREEGKTLACCATLQSDAVIEADIDDEPDARIIPVRDFAGTVRRIETLTPTIKALHIELDEAIDFQAGQYVNLEIPGLGIRRAFSLANPPSSGRMIELNVRLVPGGQGTTWLHQQLREGDTVRLSGPYGRFFVRRSVHLADGLPALFIAGGSGLSSPRSMVLDLLEQDWALPITLVYGQRHLDELYGHAEFEALAARYPNFRYVPVLSHEPEESDWRGARGFVHEAARMLHANDFRGQKAYLCGPPAMVDACIKTLMGGRLFERDIHTEKFLSAADAQQTRSPLFRSI